MNKEVILKKSHGFESLLLRLQQLRKAKTLVLTDALLGRNELCEPGAMWDLRT